MNRNVGNKPIEKFPIRFAAVATRLDNGQKLTLLKVTQVKQYVRLVVFQTYLYPATIGNQKYVDGGLVSPIPVKQHVIWVQIL